MEGPTGRQAVGSSWTFLFCIFSFTKKLPELYQLHVQYLPSNGVRDRVELA
jgi:hypothetical protein